MTSPASDPSGTTRRKSLVRRSVAGRIAGFLWRWRPKFRLADLIWLSLIAALLMTWYRDHQSLKLQLAQNNGLVRTSWSINQLLGKPNTPIAGDQQTAWASSSQDGQVEWIVVEFPTAVDVATVEVVETYNPGAVVRVCSVSMTGKETEMWRGVDPIKPVGGMGRSLIKPTKQVRTRRIKVYLDSPSVAGWNEIDAVAIHSKDGKVQWATNSWASTSYGDHRDPPQWYWP